MAWARRTQNLLPTGGTHAGPPPRRRDASGTTLPQAGHKRDLLLFPMCGEDFVGRFEEDVVVEPDGPVADVIEVDVDALFVGEFVAA